jgi:hypothetical protein
MVNSVKVADSSTMYLSVGFNCCRIEDTLEYARTAASRALNPSPDLQYVTQNVRSGLTWSSGSMGRLSKVLNLDGLNCRSDTNGAL